MFNWKKKKNQGRLLVEWRKNRYLDVCNKKGIIMPFQVKNFNIFKINSSSKRIFMFKCCHADAEDCKFLFPGEIATSRILCMAQQNQVTCYVTMAQSISAEWADT